MTKKKTLSHFEEANQKMHHFLKEVDAEKRKALLPILIKNIESLSDYYMDYQKLPSKKDAPLPLWKEFSKHCVRLKHDERNKIVEAFNKKWGFDFLNNHVFNQDLLSNHLIHNNQSTGFFLWAFSHIEENKVKIHWTGKSEPLDLLFKCYKDWNNTEKFEKMTSLFYKNSNIITKDKKNTLTSYLCNNPISRDYYEEDKFAKHEKFFEILNKIDKKIEYIDLTVPLYCEDIKYYLQYRNAQNKGFPKEPNMLLSYYLYDNDTFKNFEAEHPDKTRKSFLIIENRLNDYVIQQYPGSVIDKTVQEIIRKIQESRIKQDFENKNIEEVIQPKKKTLL